MLLKMLHWVIDTKTIILNTKGKYPAQKFHFTPRLEQKHVYFFLIFHSNTGESPQDIWQKS